MPEQERVREQVLLREYKVHFRDCWAVRVQEWGLCVRVNRVLQPWQPAAQLLQRIREEVSEWEEVLHFL